jgi:hypothetical protein
MTNIHLYNIARQQTKRKPSVKCKCGNGLSKTARMRQAGTGQVSSTGSRQRRVGLVSAANNTDFKHYPRRPTGSRLFSINLA